MMTEAQAKARGFCPFQFGMENGRCFGSLCMVWRWTGDEVRGERVVTDSPERPSDIPADWTCEARPLFVLGRMTPQESGYAMVYREPEEAYRTRRTGYCGLAGAAGCESR